MHRTRIKICGITRPADALAAAKAGADAVGLVLHGPSKRLIHLDQAKEIVKELPPFVSAVGLFVNAPPEIILKAANTLGLAAIQLHGTESPEIAASLAPLPIIKAVPVDANFDNELNRWRSANLFGLLLDTAGGGGSGRANDWEKIAAADLSGLRHLIVAGGLTPENVAGVIRRLNPWAVDVSSGVENRPGEKSVELIGKFIAAVRSA